MERYRQCGGVGDPSDWVLLSLGVSLERVTSVGQTLSLHPTEPCASSQMSVVRRLVF